MTNTKDPTGVRALSPEDDGPSGASDSMDVTLLVNGTHFSLRLEPRVTLLDALREYIGLTGTKKGCDHGQCGACTVLVDGRRINSCLTLAVMQTAKKITTVEGLARGDKLHPMQAAFIKHDAFPCGYCTPGQLCSAVGLLNEGLAGSEDDIRELMSGNICRCGAYSNILSAVREVRDAAYGERKPASWLCRLIMRLKQWIKGIRRTGDKPAWATPHLPFHLVKSFAFRAAGFRRYEP